MLTVVISDDWRNLEMFILSKLLGIIFFITNDYLKHMPTDINCITNVFDFIISDVPFCE